MPVLYLTEQGATLGKRGERLVIQLKGVSLSEIPIRRVERVVLFGRTGVTTAALNLLLKAQIPLFFLTLNGKIKGMLQAPKSPDVLFRYRQYEIFRDPARCLDLAKAMIRGKIRNQRNVLRRIQKNRSFLSLSREINMLSLLESLVQYRQGFSSLRGLEGRATYHYFQGYRKAFPEEFPFHQRTRRPPRNPVNSLLSFGYTLLTTELWSFLWVHGLDPYLGIYHRLRFGRPALALDLAEEFRHPVIDLLVLDIVSHRKVKPTDFLSTEEGGWLLNRKARGVFFRNYEQRMNHRLKGPDGKRYTLRKLMELQVLRLKNAIQSNQPYQPFSPP